MVILMKRSPNLLFFGIRCTDESFKIKTMNVLNMVIFDFMLTLTIHLNGKEHVAVSLSSLKLYKLLSVSVKMYCNYCKYAVLKCYKTWDMLSCDIIWPNSKSKTNSATQSEACSNIPHFHYVCSPTCEIRTTKTVIKSVHLNIGLCTSFIFMKNITVSFPPSSKTFSHLNCSISPCDTRPGVRCLLTGGHTLLGFYFTGVFI